ncbi:MAG: tRNA (guanosine(37)-N1)-methyltransferase TrmD [Clostridiales Family XIII bacterium]|jgi:tRNA (guanine37-N1)-methyltransferase|nr:tRNA (guanosine(37)-N1)-methyltransferase TrmD [Clostridiales Family XIII bacterium]
MRIQVLTLFPEMFAPVLNGSILGRARERGLLDVETVDIRAFSTDRHRKTDDYPFGGGAGMVLMPQPVFDALDRLGTEGKRLVCMSPQGRRLDQELALELARAETLLILCGHYEGIDRRILDHFHFEEISVGDYILTGGELPAMILIDAAARLLPGALGNPRAHDEESHSVGLLEYPQYTRPACFRGMETPAVLLSGDHKRIRLWKFEESLRLTRERRPDLFARFLENHGELDKDEKRILERLLAE